MKRNADGEPEPWRSLRRSLMALLDLTEKNKNLENLKKNKSENLKNGNCVPYYKCGKGIEDDGMGLSSSGSEKTGD